MKHTHKHTHKHTYIHTYGEKKCIERERERERESEQEKGEERKREDYSTAGFINIPSECLLKVTTTATFIHTAQSPTGLRRRRVSCFKFTMAIASEAWAC